MSPTTNVTVLVPAWNDARELPGTLDALARAASTIDGIEVVVAAGGEPGQYEEARRLGSEFAAGPCTVIPQRPLGKMRALREAMETVSSRPARYLLVLDADTRIDADGLAAATVFLDQHAELAGIGGLFRWDVPGVGATHDRVNIACQTLEVGLTSVSGGAIMLRGGLVWPHWQQIFAEHDYPLHIDYQICERIAALTGLSFVVHPAFTMQTPRARGFSFLESERRHHRAMFARAPIASSGRYVAGAALTTALPVLAPLAFAAGLVPVLWPVALPAAFLCARRVWLLKRRYDRACRVDAAVASSSSFPAFLRDEWVFAFSALLGVADRFFAGVEPASFRGYRSGP
ncbi:MAG TPA: glycosyltransferase [Polyangia bacterium]|jgi:hypothetical protein